MVPEANLFIFSKLSNKKSGIVKNCDRGLENGA